MKIQIGKNIRSLRRKRQVSQEDWWAGISEEDMTTTALPNYGFYTPGEETLCLLGDIRGKNVLEIACGSGDSLAWMGERGARELWGLDISAAQIKRTDALLRKSGREAELFVSPMELNPGLPHGHFDLVFSIYGLGWTMDLDKTINHISQYLKPGGRFVFSWDNPLMQCIASQNGRHSFTRSYVCLLYTSPSPRDVYKRQVLCGGRGYIHRQQ